jgi:hypothetical protein
VHEKIRLLIPCKFLDLGLGLKEGACILFFLS